MFIKIISQHKNTYNVNNVIFTAAGFIDLVPVLMDRCLSQSAAVTQRELPGPTDGYGLLRGVAAGDRHHFLPADALRTRACVSRASRAAWLCQRKQVQ